MTSGEKEYQSAYIHDLADQSTVGRCRLHSSGNITAVVTNGTTPIPALDQLAARITEAPEILFEPLVTFAFAAESLKEATLTYIEVAIVAFLAVDIGPKDTCSLITNVALAVDIQQRPLVEV